MHHLSNVFGSEFIGGQQAVHDGFVLAKPEVVGAGGILRAAGAIAVDPEVRGVDQTRLEHRNVNIQQGHFLAQAFAQAHHRELAGRIAPNTHLTHAAGGRSGDDDAPGAPRAHVRQHGLGQFHDAEDVDVVEPADLLHAEIFKEAAQSHARKVHHRVDAAGLADDGVDGAIDVGAAGHVHAQGGNLTAQAAPGGLFAQFLLFGFGQRRSEDAEIAGGQQQCGCQPQAGARASDQYNGFIVSHSVSHSITPRRAASCR